MSANGGSVGRREALAALAYELDRRNGRRLGEAATKLAWSPPEPQPDALLALADEVEDELEARP